MYDYIRNLDLNLAVYDPKICDDFFNIIKKRFVVWGHYEFTGIDSALLELMQHWNTIKYIPAWSCMGHPTSTQEDVGYLSLFTSLPDYISTYDRVAVLFQTPEYQKFHFILDTGDVNLLWIDGLLHKNFSSDFNNVLYPTLTVRWIIKSDVDAPEIVSLIKKLFQG